jgi:hypothetical protein
MTPEEFEGFLIAARRQGVSTLKIGDVEVSLYPVIPGKSVLPKDGETQEEAEARRDRVLFHSAR